MKHPTASEKGSSMEHTTEKNPVRPVARAGPVLGAVTGAVLAVLGCAVLIGCSKPTKPKDVKYNIYISVAGYRDGTSATRFDQLFVYDADSLTLRDSIPLRTMAMELEVSPDGRWLYAQCTSWGPTPGGLYKIDALTKQVAWSIPGNGLITPLDGGRLLTREVWGGTDVIDAATGDAITRLPFDVRILKGPPNGTRVAAIVPADTIDLFRDTLVTVFDVKSGETYGHYVPRLSTGEALEMIYTARLHQDGKRVMVIGLYGYIKYCWFMIGDVETGETLLRHRLYSPFGEIAISEDGALAVASDPSQPLIGESRTAVEFFDLNTMQHLKTIGGPVTLADQIRFLLGDRKIAISPTPGFTASPFCIVDRATFTVENKLPFPEDELFVGALGVGPRP
jgi:hypothetical protein